MVNFIFIVYNVQCRKYSEEKEISTQAELAGSMPLRILYGSVVRRQVFVVATKYYLQFNFITVIQ